jgi:hypothetical protein
LPEFLDFPAPVVRLLDRVVPAATPAPWTGHAAHHAEAQERHDRHEEQADEREEPPEPERRSRVPSPEWHRTLPHPTAPYLLRGPIIRHIAAQGGHWNS